ncbi:hypothetical protein GCM10011363_46260 [Marivita lacus]|uniref:CENP-V/GFA domain-containing protein n=2 Tax=Marivita lacus TaxID=1323742 RepID=A0ABQ1LH00_9RHOB|nr:hypothetical protein GCM10011363_46260 [Marivita lacus]
MGSCEAKWEKTMTGTCLCGAASITIEAKPDFIHDCNCDLCRKSGGAWGYFSSPQVRTDGPTSSVMRNDKADPAAEVHSCRSCHTTMHFVIAKSFQDQHGPVDIVGVNMRLFELHQIEGVEVRFPNGKDWSGVGAFEYRRPAATIDGQNGW